MNAITEFPELKLSPSFRYTLSVGLGLDRSGERIPKAIALARELCLRYFGAYSFQRSEGGWRNAAGFDFQEPSLLISFSVPFAREEAVLDVCNALKSLLNQEAVYVELTEVKTALV